VRSIADTPKLYVVPRKKYEYNKSSSGDMMSAPSKVHNIRLAELQFDDWLATTSGENSMGTDPHIEVERVSVHNSRDVGDVLPKSRVREKPEVQFCEVAHNNLGANTLIGGAL